MRTALPLLAIAASLLFAPVAVALNEFGIEGMGVVSTKANEGRASISADGQHIVFASDRSAGVGGWDLWQATLREGRWQDPQPLAFNSAGDDVDPYFSRDGRWLLFASDRNGGLTLYRVAIGSDGRFGMPETWRDPADAAPERAPALSADGLHLLFSRQRGKAHGWDLFAAPVVDGRRGAAIALEGLNTAADESDGDWLGRDGAVVFTRAIGDTAQVWRSGCAWTGEAVQPVMLSFNTADGHTATPVVDNAKPGELMLVSRSARAPRAGGTDVYRMMTPRVEPVAGCGPTVGAASAGVR
ncbi:TolB family protein [Stenotrophomonas sp. WHRI 8082]|uniref:TolB family protein n=1 Tax=Stenotrophomonas sp. WHRI 8082 TaxID=3162571 RepID=UPI0032EAA847